ncbi:hypothetical protein ATDW_20960 [Asticcacaulis sp. DW145]|uniref:hypothetical protein n=1 Tax=Asticcacaulis sp. DW145 TaxID=3095608 RepID=UPI00308CFC41|nr:hypothetical protein ATDW_20960 [Asticcacaulis sp. DW145]
MAKKGPLGEAHPQSQNPLQDALIVLSGDLAHIEMAGQPGRCEKAARQKKTKGESPHGRNQEGRGKA